MIDLARNIDLSSEYDGQFSEAGLSQSKFDSSRDGLSRCKRFATGERAQPLSREITSLKKLL